MTQRSPTDHEITVYAENYIIHGIKSKAWRVAFPDSKGSLESSNVEACLFHKIPNVIIRIEELKKLAKKVAIEKFEWSAEERLKNLKNICDAGQAMKVDQQKNEIPVNLAAAVSAISEANKMTGAHAATKFAIGGDIDAPPISIDLIPSDPVEAAKAYQKMLEGK